MSELSSETNPQILVNSEQREQQWGDPVAVEEQSFSVSLDDDCSEDTAEKETQAKMQSVFQKVRNQIRSQVGTKSSIVEVVQRVRDREMEIGQVNGEPEGKNVSSEEKKQEEMLTDDSKDGLDLKEGLCAVFEKKLEASKKALRVEFEVQISQVRKEMQAYTDQALKQLECKMQSRQAHNPQPAHPKEQQESKGPAKKQKPPAAPSMASKRGRVLTRTMTAIIPKTCAPVIIGPRAKSETLSSSKGDGSRLLSLPGNKPFQGRKPLLFPACPPDHCKKTKG